MYLTNNERLLALLGEGSKGGIADKVLDPLNEYLEVLKHQYDSKEQLRDIAKNVPRDLVAIKRFLRKNIESLEPKANNNINDINSSLETLESIQSSIIMSAKDDLITTLDDLNEELNSALTKQNKLLEAIENLSSANKLDTNENVNIKHAISKNLLALTNEIGNFYNDFGLQTPDKLTALLETLSKSITSPNVDPTYDIAWLSNKDLVPNNLTINKLVTSIKHDVAQLKANSSVGAKNSLTDVDREALSSLERQLAMLPDIDEIRSDIKHTEDVLDEYELIDSNLSIHDQISEDLPGLDLISVDTKQLADIEERAQHLLIERDELEQSTSNIDISGLFELISSLKNELDGVRPRLTERGFTETQISLANELYSQLTQMSINIPQIARIRELGAFQPYNDYNIDHAATLRHRLNALKINEYEMSGYTVTGEIVPFISSVHRLQKAIRDRGQYIRIKNAADEYISTLERLHTYYASYWWQAGGTPRGDSSHRSRYSRR